MPRVCRRLIRMLAPLVPRGRRREWRREWLAEIDSYGDRRGAGSEGPPLPRSPATGSWDLLRRCLGATVDALHLRSRSWSPDMLVQDLRYALRSLVDRPGFTIVAVVTLALAIGANTAIFSVVSGLLLEPLPYDEPERLLRVRGSLEVDGLQLTNLNPLDIEDFRRDSDTLEEIAAGSSGSATLTSVDPPLRLQVGSVWPSYFRILGIDAARGRTFLESEMDPGRHRVAVLSHGAWQRLFGGDEGIVGRRITLSGERYTVVGVAPAGFVDPFSGSTRTVDLWRPFPLDREAIGRGGHFLVAIARLTDGARWP